VLHYHRHNWSTGQAEQVPIVSGTETEKTLQEILNVIFKPHFWRSDAEWQDRQLRRWQGVLATAPTNIDPLTKDLRDRAVTEFLDEVRNAMAAGALAHEAIEALGHTLPKPSTEELVRSLFDQGEQIADIKTRTGLSFNEIRNILKVSA